MLKLMPNRSWIALLLVATVLFAAAAFGSAATPFDGILAAIPFLFALAVCSRVRVIRQRVILPALPLRSLLPSRAPPVA